MLQLSPSEWLLFTALTRHIQLWTSYCNSPSEEERQLPLDTLKRGKKDQEQVREKAFRGMKKDVGMTTAQKSKETRRMESLFCISSQQSLHVRTLLHYNLKLPDVYVGIVGLIYRTKIPSFLFPYFAVIIHIPARFLGHTASMLQYLVFIMKLQL